jgi:hypothetical protein
MNWHKSDLAKRVINSSDAKEDWVLTPQIALDVLLMN